MADIHNSLVKDMGSGTTFKFVLDSYNTFIKHIPNCLIVEIGVYNGCFLLPITKLNNNQKSYGIDPYTAYVQNDIEKPNFQKRVAEISNNQERFNQIYERLLQNIAKFNLNIEIIRDKAENVFNTFENETIDVLRIDGNHDTEYVYKDLVLYIPKIKKNGVILMDDTNWNSVNTAMETFLKENSSIILEKRCPVYSVLRKIN